MENRNIIAAIVAGVVVVFIAVFIFLPSSEPVETAPIVVESPPVIEQWVEPEPVVEESIEEAEEVFTPELPLAPRIVGAPDNLNKSDDTSRSAGNDLSVQLGRWLSPNEQIRKWVVLVDRAADGELPSKHRPLALSLGRFKVKGGDQSPVFDEANYQRYTPVIKVLESIPVEKLAYYLSEWQPLFEQAYAELGKAGVFEQRFLLALDQVLMAEPLNTTPDLIQPSVMYKYKDVRLESASAIQKLMWRMGPDNMARVQLYLESLRQAFTEPQIYRSDF